MGSMTRTQGILLGLIVVVLVATKPLYAQAATSCFGQYAQFTTASWNTLESCIQETNNQAWYSKLATRTLCNANWVSDALQAEGTYASCMSGFTSFFDK